MKSFELQPTPENILEEFTRDTLGRDMELFRFVELVNSIDAGQSIVLTENWGAGKTFFVKQLKLVLDSFNTHLTSISDSDRSRVKNTLEQLKIPPEIDIKPQISVYYDAWSNDNDEDPILSIIYSILESMSSEFQFENGRDFLSSACAIAEVLSGRSFSNLKNALSEKNPFEELRKGKNLQIQINDFLNSLLPERGNRLVIIIDELDRCSPRFAVRLLERVKHYFTNENLTFIFSVNLNELQHTIKSFYGNDFDACRYLDRFFDFSIELPPANCNNLYERIGLYNSSEVYNNVCNRVVEKNHFSIREALKFHLMATTAMENSKYKCPYWGSSLENALVFSCIYFVPIMIGLKMKSRTQYLEFIEGNNTSPIIEFFDGAIPGQNLMNLLLSSNECYESSAENPRFEIVTPQEKAVQVYNAIFNYTYTFQDYEILIGKTKFTSKNKDFLLHIISMLSESSGFTS